LTVAGGKTTLPAVPNVLDRLRARLKRRERTPEDIAAAREASRISDEVASSRIGTKTPSGDYYISQRKSRH
jgi:hypothetical protein